MSEQGSLWAFLKSCLRSSRFETPALFTVCKLISTEALDAFFEENTAVIKASRADSSYSTPDSDLVPLPNCELLRNVVLEGWFVNDNVLTQAINFCEQLPKIKAIVVECDSNQMERVTLHLSAPSIVTGSRLTCINGGVYIVDTAASGKDYFERSKVVEIWKAFQAVDGTIGFDQAYAKHCANGWHARATPSRIVGRLSAAEFIALYDEWRSVKWPQP